MDGFEACDRLNLHLNALEQNVRDQDQINYNEPHKSRTLLFCLTADLSEETNSLIRLHPFDGVFKSLNQDVIKVLKNQIKQQNPQIPYIKSY